MRGGVLLGIGVVLMLVALGLVGAVAVYALRLEEQAVYKPPAEPAEPAPIAPVEELERKEKVPMPEREKRVAPGGGVPVEPPPESPGPSLTSPPEAEPPLPEVREPAPDPPDPGGDLDGDVPAADTATLVAARTCSGGRLMLNVAEKRMFDLHNRARVGQGLGNLCIAPNLTKLARLRSEDMLARGYFSHDTPEGTNVLDQMKGLGYYSPSAYHTAGENLAKGGDGTDTDTPEYMFNGLMHSPGHRENILRGEFSEVGVGARSGTYQEYADVATIYTVVFGGR